MSLSCPSSPLRCVAAILLLLAAFACCTHAHGSHDPPAPAENLPVQGHEPPMLRNMTEEELKRIHRLEAQLRFAKEHEGHDAMHAEMLFIMFATMLLAQVALFLWSRFFAPSYQTVTLVGMWLVPILYSMHNLFYRFIASWILFSLATAFIVRRATRKPITPNVPRLVYRYFFLLYKAAYVAGIAGYLMLLADIFGASPHVDGQQNSHTLMQYGLLILFYSLYYGVLARDCADICALRMASSIGYYSPQGIPLKAPTSKVCALCGDSFKEGSERSVVLSCDHVFHEFCIRGWCIVGKKQTCPYCKEKVDLKAMFPSPWARQDVMFSAFLDGVRYLVVWQPAIMLLVQGIVWFLDLK